MGARAAGLVHRICALALGLAVCAGLGAPARAGGFSGWAAVVVAGDWRGATGGPTEAFDNARRDVALALAEAGFDPARIRQFSVNPDEAKRDAALTATPRGLYEAMSALAADAEGCVFYLTSHGEPRGALIGDQVLPPGILGRMLDSACGAKPTVVVISACFSGVFVPELAKPNRMVLTAARPDRTSFGCGEADRYPYFDECFLAEIDAAPDLAALAPAVRGCVAQRETAEGVRPPSEPQIAIGAHLRPMLPLLRLRDAGPP